MTSVAATLPVPHSRMSVTGVVLLFVPLNAVWLNRSRANPVTRTKSPASTVFAEPVKTKMPSEVAASPSPTGSWMKKPLFAAVPSKSPTTTPSVVRMPVSAALAPLPWIW